MKKSLVALAALAATGAFAQTVTLTGGVSMGAQQATIRDSSSVTLGQATRVAGADLVTGNSISFTATEDLGGGMKVTAVNQQRLGALNGGGSTSDVAAQNQNSFLGTGDLFLQVEGGFGTIKAGKFTFGSNAGYNTFGVRAITAISPTAAASGLSSSGDNILQYTTPDFNGLKVWLGVGLPGLKIGQDPAVGVRLTYDQGPLNLHFVHTSSINGDSRAASGTSASVAVVSSAAAVAPIIASVSAAGRVTVDTIAANYDFGMAKLSAAYFRRVADAPIPSTAPEANGYSVGLAVPVGAATFKAGVMNNSKTNTLLDRTAYGVDYALSKRTTLIAEYARDKRADSGDYATNNYFVGVSHTF